MRTHLFRAAVAVAAIVPPLRAEAEIAAGAAGPRPIPAHVVVDRPLADRGRLWLDSRQVAELTKLADRLRADRGRPKLVGLDRVPGKSVPRYIRVFPTSGEALESALDRLTAHQRVEAARLLREPERGQGPADRREEVVR